MAENKGMTNPAANSGDIFDVRKIRRLVELMQEHDLAEIDLRDADVRIRLRKHVDQVVAHYDPRPMAPAPAPAPAVAATKPPATTAPVADESHLVLIKSPMVGTFFATPNPESPSFVKVGDHVGPDTTVCIIEAMKVFNEIPAETSGKIVAVLVQSGDPVEYNQALFKVDPRQ
jgi:acetyl-CoA carboxylase biotin carboxyl carrier protein